MNPLTRLVALIESAVEAVIDAVVDVIFAQWIEETARAAKEESCPWNGCASCTSVDEA